MIAPISNKRLLEIYNDAFSTPAPDVIDESGLEEFPGTAYVLTATGRAVSLSDPRHEDISLTDIALGLSKLCRYTGQCSEFYSVAQHSVLALWMSRRRHVADFRLQGGILLHDASEAYLSDLSAPLKRLRGMEFYKSIEQKFQSVICETFNVTPLTGEILSKVKSFDMRMLSTERRDLMPPSRYSWGLVARPYPWKIKPWDHETAASVFYAEARSLGIRG